jgi:hypothetical protein
LYVYDISARMTAWRPALFCTRALIFIRFEEFSLIQYSITPSLQ